MRLRSFGNTGLQVTELGLGCARIGGVFQGDTLSFVRLLAVARDAGINFFDTADMYSQGESESLLGRAFSEQRSQVVIATKAGYCLPGRRKLAGRLKPILRPVIRTLGIRRDRLPDSARGVMAQDFSPAYLVKALEASLRRLRTDYVDLFQLHSPPMAVVERGEWEPALEDLKRAGKIRYYGIACDSLETGLAALRYPGVSSLQFTFSLLEQKAEQVLLPETRARGIAGIARETLGNGLLAKDATEIELARYCSSPEEEQLRTKQLAELRQRSGERGVALPGMALEFASRTNGVSVALVGARTPQQLTGLLDDFPA
ncbi:MAG TPA: aldo/keto reductase [Polyangiaceae bacterium]|jgi:aryl-alcohol dehydrogenase-like predicted oxidoreductase|nr:aldo/keto reductase [Polyangiaceae bacterium]